TIIEDCYNASLDSTRSILDYVNSLSWKGNKKVVLGPMKELGAESKTAHEEVARRILRSDIRSTFLYGEEMHDAYRLLKASGWDGELLFTDDFDTLADEVSSSVRRGDLFLVKGSRAATMERLLPVLKTAG
ncbi:MAG: UDP-N-acetylmuramoylalanyl-D-glutamate--2,6-diaminopimelate ligase, partial [Sphaerochaetaceae bacterium]